MEIDFSYMEIVAKPTSTNFDSMDLNLLEQTMYRTQIHTFGWPIGIVNYSDSLKPRPIAGGIEATVSTPGHRDFWALKRSGEFYFIGELFENNRNASYIFIDTRTNRIAESFLRVGGLYEALGVPPTEIVDLSIKHGNIAGKILGAANTARVFPVQRKSHTNEVKTEFSIPVIQMTEISYLKLHVHRAVRDLAEMFDMFNPDKASFTDPIVEAFKNGRII